MNTICCKVSLKDKEAMSAIGETPSELIFWSFKYFLGLHSEKALGFAENLYTTYPFLDKKTRILIEEEIKVSLESENLIFDSPLINNMKIAWQRILER